MAASNEREILPTPELCPTSGASFDPQAVLDVARLAEFLSSRGIDTSERQSMRLFAERGFPRFFIGRKQYALAGKAWVFVTSRGAKR